VSGRGGLLALLLFGALASCGATPTPGANPPLVLERTIPLPGVKGRIDHLALDAAGHRLFVAALGNNTVEVVDLRQSLRIARIVGQSEPQGLAWLADRRELVVASGDGQVGFYEGQTFKALAVLKLGDDADNVRVEPTTGRPVVGFGKGGLAILDPARRALAKTVRMPGHPESFRIEGGRAYVNVPDAGRIVVADLAGGGEIASWPTPGARWNFPMAIDAPRKVLAVVFRLPARLRLIDPDSGRALSNMPTCGDADDLFFDSPRRRLYVICGSGAVDVFQARGPADYAPLARVATRGGARTGLYSAEDDRLYVAARATGDQPAGILVFRPAP
jgi:DNA-binding beta-propeller fold protein YncE